MTLFSTKVTQKNRDNNGDNEDDEISDDDDRKEITLCNDATTPVEQTPGPQQVQQTISDMFGNISKQLMERDNMLDEAGYLLSKIHEILNVMRNDMSMEMFVERDANDYNSVFNYLLQSKTVFGKTQSILENLELILKNKEMDVVSLQDLLIKFSFHGLRMTEHEECKDNEYLLYCNCCCNKPKYPKDGRGRITQGLVINVVDYKSNLNKWLSTKKLIRMHFWNNYKHYWSLDYNKNKFDDMEFEAQFNQFSKVLRMTKSNQADIQYPNEIGLLAKFGVNVGNIGHSSWSLKKLRHFLSNQVCKGIHSVWRECI